MTTTVIQDFVAQFNFVVNQNSVNNTVNNINNVTNAANNATRATTNASFNFGKMAASMAAVGASVLTLEKSTIKYATSLRDTAFEAHRLGFANGTAINHFKALTQGAIDAGFAIGSIEDALLATRKAMNTYGSGGMNAFRQFAPNLPDNARPEEIELAVLKGMREQYQQNPGSRQNIFNSQAGQWYGEDVVNSALDPAVKLEDAVLKRQKEIGHGQDDAVKTAVELAGKATTAMNTFDDKLAKGMVPAMELADVALDKFIATLKDLPPSAVLGMHYLDDLKGIAASLIGILALLGFGGGAAAAAGGTALAAIGAAIGTALVVALGLVVPSSLGKPGEKETAEELKPQTELANNNASRKKRAIEILKQGGMSQEAAEGYVANFLRESNNSKTGQVLDPNISNGSHYGISQWSSTRQADFAKWAGYSMTDSSIPADKKFDDEMKFAAYELTQGSYAGTYGKLKDQNKTAGDWGESLARKVVVPFDPSTDAARFDAESKYRRNIAEGLHEGNIVQNNNVTINAGNANATEVKNAFDNATNRKLEQMSKERSGKGVIR